MPSADQLLHCVVFVKITCQLVTHHTCLSHGTLLLHRGEAQAAAKKLLQLEKERDKYSVEAGEANSRYLQVRIHSQ
jgi:hypothetical protein